MALCGWEGPFYGHRPLTPSQRASPPMPGLAWVSVVYAQHHHMAAAHCSEMGLAALVCDDPLSQLPAFPFQPPPPFTSRLESWHVVETNTGVHHTLVL